MLYIFTFNNGQIMLIEISEYEIPNLASTLIRRMKESQAWLDSRYNQPDSEERPDSFFISDGGAVIDCSHLMAFGPYVEPPKVE